MTARDMAEARTMDVIGKGALSSLMPKYPTLGTIAANLAAQNAPAKESEMYAQTDRAIRFGGSRYYG